MMYHNFHEEMARIMMKTDHIDKWNCIVYIVSVMSVFLDFSFMYVPSASNPKLLYMDWRLAIQIAISRSILDAIILCDMILKFYIEHVPLKPNVCEARQKLLKKDPAYLKSLFILDLLAIIPLAQFLVGFKNDDLVIWVMAQLFFKVIAWSPYRQREKVNRILMKNAWLGALQNLFYFIVTGNGLGALYYDGYMESLRQCAAIVIKEDESDAAVLDWDGLLTSCTKKYGQQYGLYSDAFSTKIGTRNFIQKYAYCLSWGLKSLSSFGQIFNASSYSMETVFSFIIVIFGLILFGDLLAKMQTALQCTEVKEDRQRTRQRMVEQWMNYHQLPQPLKKQVKQAVQSEWSTTRGINNEIILDSLPMDTRSDIRRHMYLDIIHTMPLFQDMDEDLVNAICGYLRTFSSNRGTYVAFEGEPVRQMLFVFSGQLEVSNANNVGQCKIIESGDLCGKELLEWCSHPTRSTDNFIPATQTIKCITDVDAFALRVDDMKLLSIQFHRNGKFRRAFQRYAA